MRSYSAMLTGALAFSVLLTVTACTGADYTTRGDATTDPPRSIPGDTTDRDQNRERGGSMQVEGTITDEGVECTALRSSDGQLYTLAGSSEALTPGDRVRVTGSVAEISFCQQGTTISVERIERLE